MLERHHLAIIHTVIETGTLTNAAQALHLTQPALSHTIKKLEDLLGTPVWEKEGRHIRLTRAGEYLYHMAQRLLPQFERGETELKRFAQGLRGSLRIGMECHPCYQWLLRNVRPYLEQWQDVDVDVHQQFQFKGIAALFAYEVDVLITPDPIFREGLQFTPAFPYELKLAMHQAHPLAQKAQIEPADLCNETLFTYPVPDERLDIFQRFLLPANQNVAQHKRVETTEILLEMVAANRGITAIPGWLLESQFSHLPLVSKSIGAGVHKHIYLGVRENDMKIDYIQGFIQQCLATNDTQ